MKKVETMPTKKALGHVLAEDAMSRKDVPSFDIAHYDGYAIRSIDTKHASPTKPLTLKVLGEMNILDEPSKFQISEGEAVHVPTGAPLPKGADAIVPVEQVREEGGLITIIKPIDRGYHVTPKGSDIRSGEAVLKAGSELLGRQVKVLLDSGIYEVKVFRKPTVCILPMGSELTDEPDEEGKRLETHSHLVAYLVEENGGKVLRKPPTPDDPERVKEMLKEAAREADIIVTIGGVSVGPKDFTWKQARLAKEVRLEVRGLKVQPGRTTSIIFSDKPLILLPGLIQSTLSGSIFVLLPLVRKLAGLSPSPLYPKHKVKLIHDVKIPLFKPFKRIRLVRKVDEGIEVLKYESSACGVLLKADGVIIVPEYVEELKKGEEITVFGVRGLL
jgi:molybdopterin biosynthesis enzyme